MGPPSKRDANAFARAVQGWLVPPDGPGLLLMAALYVGPLVLASTLVAWVAARVLLRREGPDARVPPGRFAAATLFSCMGLMAPAFIGGGLLASTLTVFTVGAVAHRFFVFRNGLTASPWRAAALTSGAFVLTALAVGTLFY